MSKYRFALIGSGWRAQYYVRVSQALPDLFELCAMLCRSEEKAAMLRSRYNVPAATDEDECVSRNPHFVVIAVSKNSAPEVAMRWIKKGFAVLCETPAAQDIETLNELWKLHEQGNKLVIAEQYFLYPIYSSLIKLVKSCVIGRVNCLNLSLAHEYHAASIMRALLEIPANTPFTVFSKTYEFPITETRTRYEEIKDGRIANKKRTIASFEFENGKTAFYDFDSEQYHSKIRKNSYKIQGDRGEILDGNVVYLDPGNEVVEAALQVKSRHNERAFKNPNPEFYEEISGISFQNEQLYEPPFGLCNISQDETAVAQLMKKTAEYAKGIADPPYLLKEALQDAYMAILMRQSDELGKPVKSEKQIWM